MTSKSDPWYFHAILYVIIAILVAVLVKVAIIDPNAVVKAEEYYKSESRARMTNIKQAEILWDKKHKKFTDNIDSLVNFVKTSPMVDSVVNGYDSLARRSTNPFVNLSNGVFTPESLMYTPKSHSAYQLEIDTTSNVDTVVSRTGRIVKIDTTTSTGKLYYLKDPDGYGSVGSLDDDVKKNVASWE